MTHALAIRHAHHSGAQVNDFMAARNRLKESFATIEEGGIPRHAAEHIATEIFDAIHDNVSTKQDLAQLGTELRVEMAPLELRLEKRIDRVVIRLGTLIVALSGIILAAIRYLPHAPQ